MEGSNHRLWYQTRTERGRTVLCLRGETFQCPEVTLFALSAKPPDPALFLKLFLKSKEKVLEEDPSLERSSSIFQVLQKTQSLFHKLYDNKKKLNTVKTTLDKFL